MPVPTSAVDICNLALDRLGQAEITSIDTPTTDVEAICARQYDQVRREVLRKYKFNFAKRYVTLTASVTKTPAFGYSKAYALPTDHVRFLTLGDITINDDTPAGLYDISEGFLFTDVANGGTINMSHIFDAKVFANYDSLFIKVFVLELAAAMAYKFTLKPSRERALETALVAAQGEAYAVSGQEKPPRRIQHSRLLNARRMGRSSDPTRY